MTIMLAGGMTIAFPGFTPDAYAANANLIVSAENTGGDVDGAQVIEIVVIDEDISASPDITVSGDAVQMTKALDGNWYAYIADTSEVLAVDNNAGATPAIVSGLDFGAICTTDTSAGGDSLAKYCGATQNVVKSEKSITAPPVAADWPFIQTYEFPGTIEIQYNKAGGTQISTITFDDVDSPGLSLDRSIYPAGAQVHVTIEDNRLNIDPTSDDIWTWNVESGTLYYMLNAGNDARVIPTTGTVEDANNNDNAGPWVATDVCGDCILLIDPNTQNDNLVDGAVLELVSLEDLLIRDTVEGEAEVPAVEEDDDTDVIEAAELIPAITAEMWFTVAEDGGPNTAVFTATNLNDDSILRIADDAIRGSFAIIDYDDSPTGIQVEFSTATIDIQSPDDVWTSGLDIPIVVVDGDANKNSLSGDDISLADVNSIIPTLVTGDPFTLGEVSGTFDILVGWDANTAMSIVILNSETADGSLDNNFIGFNNTGNTAEPDNTEWQDSDANSENNAVMLRDAQSIRVEPVSERGILTFSLPDTTDISDAIDGNDVDPDPYTIVDFLVIDIEDGYGALLDSLIDESDIPPRGVNLINYDVGSLGEDISVESITIMVDRNPVMTIDNLDGSSGYEQIDTTTLPNAGNLLQIRLNFDENTTIEADTLHPIVVDFFSFGYENEGQASDERIANQIIRLELEESDSDTGSLEGSLEYVMINQLNIDDPDTYTGITPVGQDVSFIVIEDLTGSGAPSVTYLDVDTNGDPVQVSAQEDAPSHSAVVSLTVDSFKAGDTVTVTLEDLDLNVDSGLVDIYTVVNVPGDANQDAVGEAYGASEYDGVELGRLLEITFDDERWMDHTTTEGDTRGDTCTDLLIDQDEQYNLGLGDTNFSLFETGDATGIFVGTFPIPAEFCKAGSAHPESVTGLDIEVNYVDFRDQSGETTEVGDSAGVKASTGSVSLDRTVYPVPFGIPDNFNVFNEVSTPADGNTDTRSVFPIHQSGMSDEGELTTGLDPGEFLPQGDLIVYVTVTDPDFDVSASGRDSIAIPTCFELSDEWKETHREDRRNNECRENSEVNRFNVTVDRSPVTISVLRGSEEIVVDRIGGADSPIDEIAPDAGIFEKSVTLTYQDGPESSLCPESDVDKYPDEDGDRNEANCILQGDILTVEYRDPTDASGQPNTVTDSATFDLRNGVLQSDKSVYIIGSDMILTLIEPDFDLDSSQDETYDLDLIKWSSSAATLTMGDADGEIAAFDPEPLSFRETGPSTGIFQIVIEIPQELDGDSLQRGEEIDLEYTDWGPSGADYVGDQDEDIRLTVFTSNFGATIDLDQKVYSWTDKVYITVVAPDHNFDDNLIDEIGETDEDPLRVATKGFDLDNYRLVETGFDTGIFTGEVILTGFGHDPTGDGNEVQPRTGGDGPTNGFLQTPSDGGISVSYEFSDDETVFTSSIIRWNIGDVQWLEASYPASATGVLRVIDPDMNLNPEAVDNFDVNVASDTDASGITLTVTETNEATGIFEGTIFFTTTGGSSGHRLRVSEGDTVTADYADGTLPLPYTTNDSVSITSTTIIGTIVPPLERAPATNLRIVDTFGSSIDAVSIDQQVQITADLSNGQDRDQDFAYLIQIQDSDGVTVSLSWIAGSLSPGQSFSPSASWTPTSAGTYDVTAFVWESIDNPTALSPPLSIDVSVN